MEGASGIIFNGGSNNKVTINIGAKVEGTSSDPVAVQVNGGDLTVLVIVAERKDMLRIPEEILVGAVREQRKHPQFRLRLERTAKY